MSDGRRQFITITVSVLAVYWRFFDTPNVRCITLNVLPDWILRFSLHEAKKTQVGFDESQPDVDWTLNWTVNETRSLHFFRGDAATVTYTLKLNLLMSSMGSCYENTKENCNICIYNKTEKHPVSHHFTDTKLILVHYNSFQFFTLFSSSFSLFNF